MIKLDSNVEQLGYKSKRSLLQIIDDDSDYEADDLASSCRRLSCLPVSETPKSIPKRGKIEIINDEVNYLTVSHPLLSSE